MSFGHQSLLNPEEEQELKAKIADYWMLKGRDGKPLMTGIQIAQKLRFGETDGPYPFLDPEYIYFFREKFDLPVRREYRGYPHRYKNKQEEPIDLTEQIRRIDGLPDFGFHAKRRRSFNILDFWTGLRAMEIIMLKMGDITVDGDRIVINAFRLKKNRKLPREAKIYPLELRTKWPFVECLVDWFERFPSPEEHPFEMNRWTAWNYVKQLWPEGYPHMYRFNRITALCDDPRFSITEIRAWTGLHIVTINNYISKSGRYATQAADKMSDNINEELTKKPRI